MLHLQRVELSMSPSMPERRTVGSFSKRVSHMPVIQDRVAVAPECPDRKIIVVRQLRRRFSAAQSPKHAGPCLVGDYFAGGSRTALPTSGNGTIRGHIGSQNASAGQRQA